MPASRPCWRNLVERLEIDLAAFVVSGRARPLYASSRTSALGNEDLVLTGLCGDLFRFVCVGGKPLVLNAPDDPRRAYLFSNMVYRVVACPVIDIGGRPAMMAMVRREDGPEFTNGDRSLASVVANQTAIMLQNHNMLGRLQRFGEQIAASLIAAIEAKDPYTRGHSERVQEISMRLGRAAGLAGDAIESISWGALLHDVGKIGIPETIICKAGRLDDDEYTMIKTHPERSYEIIQHIEHLGQGALDAARYHHERFDGEGYPNGLIGKAIPVEARVIAIGDSYDAITSSRPYRKARDHDAALRIIREVAGSQLDGELVQIFERMCELEPDQPPERGPGRDRR